MGKLDGRVAIVTGGSSGIGLDAAKGMGAEGAKLVLVSNQRPELEGAAAEMKELGYEVEIYEGDVCKSETSKAMVDLALSKFGAVHIGFLNAGIVIPATWEDITEEQLEAIVGTDAKSVVWGCKYLLPAMRKTAGGKGSIIVNTSSVTGSVVTGKGGALGAYAGAKSMAKKVMEYAAVQGAPEVRVNAVAPGVVLTPLWTPMGGAAMASSEAQASQLLTLEATPPNITPTVLLLASDDGAFFTGEEIRIDGGMTHRVS